MAIDAETGEVLHGLTETGKRNLEATFSAIGGGLLKRLKDAIAEFVGLHD